MGLVKWLLSLGILIAISTATYWGPSLLSGLLVTQTEEEIANQPDPALRHLQAKTRMLELTNQRRAAVGAPPVKLSYNSAAQLHAEAALKGCYSSHWDRWGLKPNHRYTLTGGSGNDGENLSGLDFCLGWNYWPIWSPDGEVEEAVQGWMDSPDHRKTLLDPVYTVLNAGIAFDRHNIVMVQQFSTDYVHYTTPPWIDYNGVLNMAGTVQAATLIIPDTVNLQVYYDPPPKALTIAQLSDTYRLCPSVKVGFVVEPLPPGSSYLGPAERTQIQSYNCVDPYTSATYSEPAADADEAHERWAYAKARSSEDRQEEIQVLRVVARSMEITDNRFSITVDLIQLLNRHGPGIYTLTLWGRPSHMTEPAVLSSQSVFWETRLPAGNPYRQTRDTARSIP